jgi:hypothetical protein
MIDFEKMAVLEYRLKQVQKNIRKTTFQLAEIDEGINDFFRKAEEFERRCKIEK